MIRTLKNENGMTLVEVMIAIVILLVGLLAMAQVMAFSVIASKSYGRDSGKSTAYARDKMEELTGLGFADTTTNVTVNAPYPANGTGLSAGGNINPSAPANGYVDYLNLDGSRTTAGSAAYTRQWQISSVSASLKTIMVLVTSNRSFRYGTPPSTTLVTMKAP
jgi:prepilin-type N-terminal cleavage/methylation domain-containing protein